MAQLDFVEPEPDFVICTGRRMPEDVQFVQATADNLGRIVDWVTGLNHAAFPGDGQVIIQALDGPITIRPGDYVIRGKRGEFSRCDAEVFAEDCTVYGPAGA